MIHSRSNVLVFWFAAVGVSLRLGKSNGRSVHHFHAMVEYLV